MNIRISLEMSTVMIFKDFYAWAREAEGVDLGLIKDSFRLWEL